MLEQLRKKMRKIRPFSKKRTADTARNNLQPHERPVPAKADEENDNLYKSFTNELLGRFYASKRDENIVFSAFSVLMLLGILARSAEGITQLEIEEVLGGSGAIDERIEWLRKLQGELTESGVFLSSNAVCINSEIAEKITPGYEKMLADTFDGKLFTAEDMLEAVNGWVNEKTKGMIPKALDSAEREILCCLLNAIAFEAKWNQKYSDDCIESHVFHNSDGSTYQAEMLSSMENLYIEDACFTGFVKPYEKCGYSYMALLPKKNDPGFMERAIKKMDLTKLFRSAHSQHVNAGIPEYRYENEQDLKKLFRELGIETAFTAEARFGPMVDHLVKIDKVLHKAFIQVDRNGTKAAAMSAAFMGYGGADFLDVEIKDVILDRPFIYAIVHSDTGIPVFTGIVNHLDETNGSDESNRDDFEPEQKRFSSDEEVNEYIRRIYRRLMHRLHPDLNSEYETSEEVQELYHEVWEAYCAKDYRRLEVIEHKVEKGL